MKEKIFKVIKVVSFVIVTLSVVSAVSNVFVPVDYSIDENEGGLHSFSAFYAEPEDSLDVIYLGSSHVFSGISPMVIYEKYGITGFDCSTSNQNAYKSLQVVKEVLKYQKPKVVVFDLLCLTQPQIRDEIANWSLIGRMKPSLILLETVLHEGGRKAFDYLFPILRYHDRWEELTAVDFTDRFGYDYAHGEDLRYGRRREVELAESDFPVLSAYPEGGVSEIDQEAAAYIKEMLGLCEKNGIEVVFIKTPVSGYTDEYRNANRMFAQECGVPLIDYNELNDATGIDFTTDFLDTVHLNQNGREKISAHLGKYLAINFGLESRSRDNWDADSLKYDTIVSRKN